MTMKYLPPERAKSPSLLRRAGTVVAATAVAGVALMFSAVLLVAVATIGTAAFAYLWWKTRHMRRQMREQMKNFPPPGAGVEREVFRGEVYEGEVIEGEATRVDESPRGRIVN